MAKFFTVKQFRGNFPADFASGISFTQLGSTTIEGITYAKALQVRYSSSDGSSWRATIGGASDLELKTVSFPPFGVIPVGIQGTLQGYLQEQEITPGNFEKAWGVSAASVKAEDVFAAMKNPNQLLALAEQVFAGNDEINLSAFDDPAPTRQEFVRGYAGNDIMRGGDGNDRMQGDGGNDRLSGQAGRDTLIGGAGKDYLYGGDNADAFVYKSREDSLSRLTSRDLIVDFNGADGDTIDLSAIDAVPLSPLNDAFVFIGARAFTGSASQGQVRFTTVDGNGLLEINLAGGVQPRIAEMAIDLRGVTSFNLLANPLLLNL